MSGNTVRAMGLLKQQQRGMISISSAQIASKGQKTLQDPSYHPLSSRLVLRLSRTALHRR